MIIPKFCKKFTSKQSLFIMVFVFALLIFVGASHLFVADYNGVSTLGQLFSAPLTKSPSDKIHVRSRANTTALTHKKWIVVTSINNPTDQIKRLSQIRGWKLLVVADKKTPSNWSNPNTIILTIEIQLSLNYAVTKLLPWNSYTRKVIGYLYATEHGAEFIYDTDDDNAPNDRDEFEKYFELKPTTRGLISDIPENTTTPTINPYAHFGQASIWPRGYPLEYIGQKPNNIYTACQMVTPLIQQGLVNGDPDVDAIFRLTRTQSPLNIQFDGSAPPLILSKKVLAPFNSQNTLFHYNALWALLLPISVESRVTDIWRGYWAQPLLWAIGASLGFYSPHTTQLRNHHIYLKDFGEEDQLYKQSGTLVKFLREWICSKDDLYKCMIELTIAMAERNFWGQNEIQLMNAWISDLKSIGYRQPHLTERNSSCLDGKLRSSVIFEGVDKNTEVSKPNYRITLREFCNLTLSTGRRSRNPVEHESILLVVTFNFPHYENIWLIDSIYRPHYPNMIYCGDSGSYNASIHAGLLASQRFIDAKIKGFSFIRANVSKGLFEYECALRVIDMNYGVKGYFVVSDDVLLNIWNIKKLNTNETWSLVSHSHNAWQGWTNRFGLNETRSSVTQIYNTSTNIFVQEFRKQRENFGYNVTSMVRSISDIFYFPKTKQDMFYEVGSIFREREVFLEIAVPMIMTGLSSPENKIYLTGENTWGNDRSFPFKHFNGSNHFIHPVKPGQVIDGTFKADYCRHYVTRVLEFGETNNSTNT